MLYRRVHFWGTGMYFDFSYWSINFTLNTNLWRFRFYKDLDVLCLGPIKIEYYYCDFSQKPQNNRHHLRCEICKQEFVSHSVKPELFCHEHCDETKEMTEDESKFLEEYEDVFADLDTNRD